MATRRTFLAASAGVAAVALGSAGAASVALGVYDPAHAFQGDTRVSIEHTFIDWNRGTNWGEGDQHKRLVNFLTYCRDRNRQALVTLEPWGVKLSNVSKGTYDVNLAWVAADLKAHGAPVMLRWAHEMETGDKRYSWSGQKQAEYIKAYQYVATKLRSLVPGVRMVWSPAGNKGCEKYYPGPGFVDHIGLSVYSYPLADVQWYGHARGFAENFGEKYSRVKTFAKPTMICELGAVGDNRYGFIRDALASPLLTVAVLFNERETGSWGATLPAPDWRVEPGQVAPLLVAA